VTAVAVLSTPHRLSAPARRATLLVHVVAGVGWIGVDLVIFVLALTGLVSRNPHRIAACYVAMNVFGTILLLPLGLLSLGAGLLLGWGSKWGILRYRWVFWKLVSNIVLTTLVVVLLEPRLAEAASRATAGATLADRLGGLRVQLMFPSVVSITTLLFATVLAIYKPWGKTAYGRRRPTD
jgi:hypothetical protein